VVIVVPIYQANLTPDEEISLLHLQHALGSYDKYFVAPELLEIKCRGIGVKRFDDRFFADTASYSKLLLSRMFYEAFAEYKYILVYQLDCLVFSDQLSRWCGAGFDYIGAPWLKNHTDPSQGFSRVGNGGLSLRRVESFLAVFDSERRVTWRHALRPAWLPDLDGSPRLYQYRKRAQVLQEARKGSSHYMDNYTLNEDRFWSDRATLFFPQFRVAPVDVALQFSFEYAPRYCYEQNGCRLPFGCPT
jgi:hypothetical protein